MNADEAQDLQELLKLLDRAKPWEELTGASSPLWDVQSGSALAGDDAKTDPYQISHSVRHALTVAVDHLNCLRSSLIVEMEKDRASVSIHTHAQSSLIRGAIENGARAVWMIGPTSRLERVKRRLSLQAGELKRSERLREVVKQPAARTKDERMKQLTDLVIAAGVPAKEGKAALRMPQYSDIVRTAGDHTALGADMVDVIWSGCSSLAHGDLSGTLGLLDREIIQREKGIALARVTGSISNLYWTTVGAVAVIDHGFRLYEQRATRHH
ncbi:hypothetical protein [Sinosporangium siamense]|nr:hypothetical protein [Sinosporangium siamense]